MKHYELLCVLPGTLSEDELQPLVSSVESVITQNGGASIGIEDLGKNRLSYPMKHIRYGYYRLFSFQAEPGAVPAIQNRLSLMRELLRVMISAVDVNQKNKLAEAKKKMLERQIAFQSEQKPTTNIIADEQQDDEVEAPKPVATVPAPEKAPKKRTVKKVEKEQQTVTMENIDEKLDKILDDTISNV